MTTAQAEIRIRRLPILRSALAGLGVLVVLFVVCWFGVALGGPNLTHMFISLFTAQPVGSQAALLEGTAFAAGFGAVSGALVALFFNLFDVGRR